MVFRCPGCCSVVLLPSISNILITLVEFPLFLNIDDLNRFFLPREELAGARRGLRSTPGATEILPNPLDAWHTPPPVDTEERSVMTIRHPAYRRHYQPGRFQKGSEIPLRRRVQTLSLRQG